MKKLLLLSALLIFACSSDDESEETFLERYDGVVWEINDASNNITEGLRMFNNETQGWIEKSTNNSIDEFCYDYAFGVPFDVCIENTDICETNIATIIENLGNRLKYQVTEIDTENSLSSGVFFSYTVLYEVSEQANDMNITHTTINSFFLTAIRTDIAQISCN
tara:strand:+ start:1731 stop:2222 length:492 start_codon:yes stop_codon:yes gene_type:complete